MECGFQLLAVGSFGAVVERSPFMFLVIIWCAESDMPIHVLESSRSC